MKRYAEIMNPVYKRELEEIRAKKNQLPEELQADAQRTRQLRI